jgi:glycosyltransferase involved in cell wall biosynthesis
MNILLIHQAFAAIDEPGGTRHHEFARFLQRQGHQVTVITGQGSYLTGDRRHEARGIARTEDDLGVRIWRTPGIHAWHRSFFHRLLSFFSFMLRSFVAGHRIGDVDLIWGTSPPIFQAASAALLARWRKVPYVFEVRDLWPYFAVASGVLRSRILIQLSEWLERWLYRQASVVIVNSPGFIEHVRARGAEKVELIPNGVDTAAFGSLAESGTLREKLGLEDQFVVLYAGAHGLSNDLPTLLAAAERLKDEPSIHFVLLGAGKEKSNLIAMADQSKLDKVHFLDPVSKQKMPAELKEANAGVAILLPIDAYKTTYPNKVFDYMAAGLPVICAIDGVIREVIEEGRAGIFVQPGQPQALAEAVESLARDPERTIELGLAGREWVRSHFDREQLALRLEQVMRDVLKP